MGVTPSSLTHLFVPRDGVKRHHTRGSFDLKSARRRFANLCPGARRRFERCPSGGKGRDDDVAFRLDEARLMSSMDDDSMREEDSLDANLATPDNSDSDPPTVSQLQEQVEILKSEKRRYCSYFPLQDLVLCSLTRALAQSEGVALHCESILEDSNSQLHSALQLVAELSGVVKYLKQREKKQADQIQELMMDKSLLSKRLESAFAEIYKQTGNPTWTLKERMVFTPRSQQSSADSSLSFL